MRQRAFRFEHIIASSLAAFIAGRYSVIQCAKAIGISPVTADSWGVSAHGARVLYLREGTRLDEVVIISRFQSESAL